MSTQLWNSSSFDTSVNASFTTINDTLFNKTTTEETNITTILKTITTTESPSNTSLDVRSRVKLLDFANNSISRSIFSQLPSGRKRLAENGDDYSCPILRNNNSLALILPGWEGIPTNIVVNIFLSIFLLLLFAFFIRKIYKTEGLIKRQYLANERSSDWIHFIFGKRGNQTILYTSRRINRDDPKAYLPLVLHNSKPFIKERGYVFKSDENKTVGSETQSYSSTDHNINESKAVATLSPTLRTKSETIRDMSEDEEQQIAHLKSILWDDDFSHSLSQSTMGRTDSNTGQQHIYSENPKTMELLSKWFKKYFLIRDQDIFNSKGYDALQYVVFQRYLLYFMGSLTIICLMIILPLNIYGGKLNDFPDTYYRRTTILNIKNESPLIYVHALMTIFVLAMGIFLMRSFSQLIGKSAKNIDKKIVLIENIPKAKRNENDLKEFFAKKFPNVVIKRITFVYEIRKLTSLMMSLWTSIEAKSYCSVYQHQYNSVCEVRPYLLGHFRGVCGCCKYYPKVDGLKYYIHEKKELENKIQKELKQIAGDPKWLAFVVFKDEEMAEKVYLHFKRKHYYCYSISVLFKMIFGHESDPFDSWQWRISYAPYPDDINWSDISTSKWKEFMINTSLNIVIVIIFLFVSTPSSALNLIRWITGFKSYNENESVNMDPIYAMFWSYIPTLGYTLMTSLLPAIIKILTTAMIFRTKSDYNYSIMYKSYMFLVLMVLILPSLEIITVFTLFESQLNINNTGEAQELKWSCLFPAENGAFFLNYVMTSAFVGTIMEVIRFSELASYTAAIMFASRTSAEYLTARQLTRFEFYFGTYYPRILLLFTLIVTFSISCPLIAPVGLFYIVLKHLGDRYLIYHVYVPTKINQRIHSKAIVYVYFALLFLVMQVYTHLSAMDYTIPSYIVGLAFIFQILFTLFEFFYDLIIYL